MEVELGPDHQGFGFSIRGGRELNLPIFVLRMAEGGAAERDGRLRVSDESVFFLGRNNLYCANLHLARHEFSIAQWLERPTRNSGRSWVLFPLGNSENAFAEYCDKHLTHHFSKIFVYA